MVSTRARYYKTLFIPGLVGQDLLWRNEISKYSARTDEVVQFGNLVSVNKELSGSTSALLKLIKLWIRTYDAWFQLIGPNEIMTLNFPDGGWATHSTLKMLQNDWLIDESRFYSTAVVNKKRLVTHGGLTYGEWVDLGRPETAVEARDLLNKKYNGLLFFGKSFKTNGVPNFSANPIFADPLVETYPSWVAAPESCPFDQVHTGASLNSPFGKILLDNDSSLLSYMDKISYRNFGSFVSINNATFISVSPPIPSDYSIKKLEYPWQPVYVEKMPVLDTRVEFFDFFDQRFEERGQKLQEGSERYLEKMRKEHPEIYKKK